MAQDTTPSIVMYIGDGSQTRFEVPFDKGAYGEIKVAFVRRGLTDYTYDPDTYDVVGFLYAWNGGVYTKTEQADTTTPLYDKDGVATGENWSEGMYREPKNDIFTKAEVLWTGDTLTTDDIICIVRDTTSDQPYSYQNNQKHIERALDNLSRQIQEVAKKTQNALLVDPSWMDVADGGVADENKLDPVSWLQTIVRSKGKTLRELRIDNDYIMYTSDDPDSTTKTWDVIAGVKTGNAGIISHIRENEVTLEDGTTERYLQYSVDGGTTWEDCSNTSIVGFDNIHGSPYDNSALATALNGKVNVDGTSIMTAPLKFMSGSMRGAVGPYFNGVGFWKLDSQGNLTQVASLSDTQFIPAVDESLTLGTNVRRLKGAYIESLNNGYDIAVPVTNSADTLALKSQVDDAANSGSQLYTTGVWYAKMLSATTIPASAEVEGRNYADFSQVDQDNNPIIVVYTYTSGSWTLTETITPPATYNGYMTITSKIWDIPEQAGQQGGLVLWSYNQKTFTPYPKIISFESINVTGDSTVTMPANPTSSQIVNKDYVDNAIVASGTGRNVGDVFFTTRTDSDLNGAVECNGGTYDTTDFTGAQSIGDLLTAGKVPYVSLAQYTTLLSTNGSVGVFGWDGGNTTTFRVPSLEDIFIETGTAAQIGDYLAPKIPNIKGSVTMITSKGQPASSGALYSSGFYYMNLENTSGNDDGNSTINIDASRSSGVYDDTATTVQPNAVRYRAMVQLAISATDEAVITCTAVTADVAAMKSHEVIEFQAPTAQNNYTWYRKYRDGWVEQGGRATTDSGNPCQVTLPVEMADTYYNINILGQTSSDGYTNATWQVMSVSTATTPKSTTSFYGQASITGYNLFFYWEVKGMYAQP